MPSLLRTASAPALSRHLLAIVLSGGALLGLGMPATSLAAAQAKTSPSAASAPASAASSSQDEGVVELDDRDPAVRAAFKKAQSTLDGFLKIASSQDPRYDIPAVRVTVTEGQRKEYVWLTPFSPEGKGFKGQINSIPSRLTKVTLGSTVRFERKDIVDWLYVDKSTKVMHGNFTTCAQLTKAPASDAAQMKKAYGLDCSKR